MLQFSPFLNFKTLKKYSLNICNQITVCIIHNILALPKGKVPHRHWDGVFQSFHHFIYVHVCLFPLVCIIKISKINRNLLFLRATITLKCCWPRLEKNVAKIHYKIQIYLITPSSFCEYLTYGESRNIVCMHTTLW